MPRLLRLYKKKDVLNKLVKNYKKTKKRSNNNIVKKWERDEVLRDMVDEWESDEREEYYEYTDYEETYADNEIKDPIKTKFRFGTFSRSGDIDKIFGEVYGSYLQHIMINDKLWDHTMLSYICHKYNACFIDELNFTVHNNLSVTVNENDVKKVRNVMRLLPKIGCKFIVIYAKISWVTTREERKRGLRDIEYHANVLVVTDKTIERYEPHGGGSTMYHKEHRGTVTNHFKSEIKKIFGNYRKILEPLDFLPRFGPQVTCLEHNGNYRAKGTCERKEGKIVGYDPGIGLCVVYMLYYVILRLINTEHTSEQISDYTVSGPIEFTRHNILCNLTYCFQYIDYQVNNSLKLPETKRVRMSVPTDNNILNLVRKNRSVYGRKQYDALDSQDIKPNKTLIYIYPTTNVNSVMRYNIDKLIKFYADNIDQVGSTSRWWSDSSGNKLYEVQVYYKYKDPKIGMGIIAKNYHLLYNFVCNGTIRLKPVNTYFKCD